MCQAMIISLGGSPEPLARSIVQHRPAFICFFASHDSVEKLGQVKDLLSQENFALPEKKVVLIDNVNDLVHCYEKALECSRLLGTREVPPEEVIVDYTGGTKTMTAALSLATVGKGYRFSYVGGDKRSKNGLGVVETGFEIVHTGVSPWQIFAVEEWRHLVLYVDQYQYEASLTLLRDTRRRLPAKEQLRWEGLEKALTGLLHWDRFNHREALPSFRRGMEKLVQWLTMQPDRAVGKFVRQGDACLKFLIAIADETNQFKRPSRLLVLDLLANAERRAFQGRYDDAIARLYRALEMLGQIAFQQKLSAYTSNVPMSKIPIDLREEYVNRYTDTRDKKIKLPLEATFRLLAAAGDEMGSQFMKNNEAFNEILQARNQSILAHGMIPLKRDNFERLNSLMRLSFDLEQTISFPKLQHPY